MNDQEAVVYLHKQSALLILLAWFTMMSPTIGGTVKSYLPEFLSILLFAIGALACVFIIVNMISISGYSAVAPKIKMFIALSGLITFLVLAPIANMTQGSLIGDLTLDIVILFSFQFLFLILSNVKKLAK